MLICRLTDKWTVYFLTDNGNYVWGIAVRLFWVPAFSDLCLFRSVSVSGLFLFQVDAHPVSCWTATPVTSSSWSPRLTLRLKGINHEANYGSLEGAITQQASHHREVNHKIDSQAGHLLSPPVPLLQGLYAECDHLLLTYPAKKSTMRIKCTIYQPAAYSACRSIMVK